MISISSGVISAGVLANSGVEIVANLLPLVTEVMTAGSSWANGVAVR